MVWLAIVIAGIGMMLIPLGKIYIGTQKKKANSKFTDDKTEGKFMLVLRIVSIVLFVGALLILHGLMKSLEATN